MCGIAGFIDPTASLDAGHHRLAAMLKRIEHRGPDERGVLERPDLHCFLGMQRLSIIDLAGGRQPIWNEDESVAVVFNGEIYNYVELRRELKASGHQFRTDSDTEVLVHLYEKVGADLVSQLRGMFAFAILDCNRRRLLLARDHFGQKPLYWHASGGRFAFTSEIKSLFALPWVPLQVNRDAFLDYISWLRLPAPHTHFQDISKVPPGTLLEVQIDDPATVIQRRFWSFNFQRTSGLSQMDAAVDELDAALNESVGLHLRSDVPVGVALSGGLDSRTVGEYARTQHPMRLQTFSVVFDGPDSESSAAAASAAALGSEHFEVTVDANDLAQSIQQVAWHLDEPVADPAAFAVWKLCEVARDHVKVLLGGEGADELFAGYGGRYQAILQQSERSAYLRKLRVISPRVRRHRFPNRWQRACYRAHLSPAAELIEARIEGLPGGTLAPWGLTNSQLQALHDRAQRHAADLVSDQGDLLSTAQVLDMQWQLAESLLLKSDKMSMAASLELRCPFLDTKVADVASRIAPNLRMGRTGEGKLVLRECLRRRLGSLQSIPKRGFPIPLDEWLRGPLREVVYDTVFARQSESRQQLDLNLLTEAWENLQRGEPLGTVFYALWLYEAWRGAFASSVSMERQDTAVRLNSVVASA